MTWSAAAGKHSTQLSLIRYNRAVPRSSASTNPNGGELFQVSGHGGLPGSDGLDDLPDGHRLTGTGSDTICTRVPSASALNQDA
jgi:hypothetical protein